MMITNYNPFTYLKVTTEFVKASGLMVGVFGANFSLSMGISSWEKQCRRSIKQEPIRREAGQISLTDKKRFKT